jgi:hypothetical protein
MSQIASILSLSSAAACLHARTGAFVLAPAQALSLSPKVGGMIRLTCGSAWITLGDGCDYFLEAEQSLWIPAGGRAVMESMRQGGALKFDWQPDLTPSATAQALLDLRGAADLAARGLLGLAGALLAGLARGFPEVLVAVLAARARSAHSSASRAHGRMASCESIASSGAV